MYISMYIYIYIRIHTISHMCTHTQIDRWMDGWMDGWREGWIGKNIDSEWVSNMMKTRLSWQDVIGYDATYNNMIMPCPYTRYRA